VSFIFPSFRVTLPSVVHLLSYVPPNGGNQSKSIVALKINCAVVLFTPRFQNVLVCRLTDKLKSRLKKHSGIENLEAIFNPCENVVLKDVHCRLHR
jgi:hypothetical protein